MYNLLWTRKFWLELGLTFKFITKYTVYTYRITTSMRKSNGYNKWQIHYIILTLTESWHHFQVIHCSGLIYIVPLRYCRPSEPLHIHLLFSETSPTSTSNRMYQISIYVYIYHEYMKYPEFTDIYYQSFHCMIQNIMWIFFFNFLYFNFLQQHNL